MTLPSGTALLFMHIPKTAGTSIRAMLDSVYPGPERLHLYEEPPGIPPGRLQDIPIDVRERARLVFGHFHYGVHEWLPQPSRYVTILREPATRLASLYHHYRRTGDGKQGRWIQERDATLEEFLLSGITLQTNNEMVRQITNRQRVRFGTCPRDMLDEALSNIDRHFEAVLVREHLGPSLAILSDIVGRPLPAMPNLNVGKGRGQAEPLAPRTVAAIRELNDLDHELYAYVARRIDTVGARHPIA